MNTVWRWLGSAVLGTAIVYVLAVAGLFAFGWFDEKKSEAPRTHLVELLSSVDRVRLKDELGLDKRRTPPPPSAPKPLRLPRQVSGFVQIEVEVGTRGEVLDAQVVGAVPEGYYEEQALNLVRGRQYEPSPFGSYRQAEVVPFNISVEAPREDNEN